MTDKLSKTFNLQDIIAKDEADDGYINIHIPENASLDDIKEIALAAFHEQIKLLAAIEPKYRQRYMEVANLYLNTAVAAASKDEDIKIKLKKIEPPENEMPKPAGYSRNQLVKSATQIISKNNK